MKNHHINLTRASLTLGALTRVFVMLSRTWQYDFGVAFFIFSGYIHIAKMVKLKLKVLKWSDLKFKKNHQVYFLYMVQVGNNLYPNLSKSICRLSQLWLYHKIDKKRHCLGGSFHFGTNAKRILVSIAGRKTIRGKF